MRDTPTGLPNPLEPPANFAVAATRITGRVVPRAIAGVAAAAFLLSAAPAARALGDIGANPGDIGRALWLWQGVVVVQALVGIAVGVVAIIRGSRSQKREISFAEQFVTAEAAGEHKRQVQDHLVRMDREIQEIRTQMRMDREAAQRADEERIGRVHERLDALQTDMAAMPSRVIALLANTGALKERRPNVTH